MENNLVFLLKIQFKFYPRSECTGRERVVVMVRVAA